MKPRDELVSLQKRLVTELQQRIDDSYERPDAGFARYLGQYESEFKQGFERVASRAEVIEQLMRANIAYFGDYHTLRTAQSAALSFLRELVRQRKRQVVLAVEMLHAADNAQTARFLAGKLTAAEFRKAVRWRKNWGFPWSSFGRFFDLARSQGLPLFGLNIRAPRPKGSLAFRDAYAAELIAALTELYPDRLIAVVYGDLHIAPGHMPAQVEKRLARFGIRRRQLHLYQNSSELYWRLVERRLEHVVDVLKVKRDAYCIMNATPLVKYQSFLNWQENSSELAFTGLEDLDPGLPGDSTLLEQVVDFVNTIAGFLKLEIPDPAGFELATAADLDLLENLVTRGIYSETEMNALKSYMQLSETAFFVRANVLYLGNLSVSHAAEGAMKYILGILRPMRVAPVAARDDFYARIMLEALAFFGSKVINPRRKPRSLEEWQELFESLRHKRRLSAPQQLDRDIAQGYIAHDLYARRVLEGSKVEGGTRALFGQGTAAHVGLTRAIGRSLGYLLFEAVNAERLPLETVRGAIFDNLFQHDVARKRYFEVLKLATPGVEPQARPWTSHADEEE